jgi:hypothetical protein
MKFGRFTTALMAVLIAVQAQAYCNLERFGFGKDFDEMLGEFNDAGMPFGASQLSRSEIAVPGELVCEGDDRFEGVLLHYIFLYGKFVEISMSRVADKLVLLDWAESMYGAKNNKPGDFFSANPGGQLVWDTFNSVVTYSYSKSEGEEFEALTLQSRRYVDLFARYSEETMEKAEEVAE